MKILVPPTMAAACILAGRLASAQMIGVYFDAAGNTTSIVQPVSTAGTMYVLALLGGAAQGGIAGAGLRVRCFPPDWHAVTVSLPASPTIGNLLGGGAQIAFPSCQGGTNGVVLLFTVTYFATTAVENHCIAVAASIPPSNPNFSCPIVVLCDAPTYTYVCVRGGFGLFNATDEQCRSWDCPVAVKPTTWGILKRLYK